MKKKLYWWTGKLEHSVDQITWRSSDLRLIVILTLKKKYWLAQELGWN